ncbi:MAG: hypothetical protein FJ091_06545 [Deltaproteobacteria bacterium]|nr:hypothetical protein [Deltaproteobacteria bacterium]
MPAADEKRDGVIFPGLTASAMLHGLLTSAKLRFNDAFRPLVFPRESSVFKTTYPHVVEAFEAVRAASPERREIARFIVEKSHRWILLRADGVERPLADALWELPEPAPLKTQALRGRGRWAPSVQWDGRRWAGSELGGLGEALVARDLATPAVAEALAWIAANALDAMGRLDLGSRRFALMGAAAEIAPTRFLLEAGAEVLWLDVAPPPEKWLGDDSLSGRVVTGERLGDLLAQPREIAAAIGSFASTGAVDCGLFAYAPGAGREWRLASTMNAIVDAVGPERVRSAALYVSPTHPAVLSQPELAMATRRTLAMPGWQRALGSLGLLGTAGQTPEGSAARVQRSVVPIQGASYQAAQYVEKVLAMERWAAYGIAGRGGQAALSANVAGITRTHSLEHPLFSAAYLGCGTFGVETFAPETTRPLNALLLLHDLLNPKAAGAPGAERAHDIQRVFAQRVHGGLYGLPFDLQPMLVAAGVIGFAKKPALLAGLLRSGPK